MCYSYMCIHVRIELRAAQRPRRSQTSRYVAMRSGSCFAFPANSISTKGQASAKLKVKPAQVLRHGSP